MKRLGLLALFVTLWALPYATTVKADPVPPPPVMAPSSGATDRAFEARLKHLDSELRCLVCQNQTLEDSSAGLAEDLRREVRGLALAGKSDDEIKSYLHDRYGNFIFYRPPVEPVTWLLWFGPFALLVATAAGLIWRIRRPRAAVAPLAEGERERIDELLAKS